MSGLNQGIIQISDQTLIGSRRQSKKNRASNEGSLTNRVARSPCRTLDGCKFEIADRDGVGRVFSEAPSRCDASLSTTVLSPLVVLPKQ